MTSNSLQKFIKSVRESPGYTLSPERKIPHRVFFALCGTGRAGRPYNGVYLLFNFAKKDGTMSKVSGLGREMPHVKIG